MREVTITLTDEIEEWLERIEKRPPGERRPMEERLRAAIRGEDPDPRACPNRPDPVKR